MTEVILHVYDVTNSGSEKTNNTILNINKIFKDAIGLGGIFHSAVQWSVRSRIHGDDEWSFGFCEQGTGVFSCPSSKNPMYTYREKIVLGKTSCSIFKILRELSREWPGDAYDLLAKNCNHFCDEFCERLGVPKLPDYPKEFLKLESVPCWVNRFANAGDAAMEVAGNTAFRFRQAKTEIVSASKVAYRFLVGVTSNNGSGLESPENSNGGVPRFQGTWFKNLIANGAKPSSSTEVDNQDENMLLQHQQSKQGADQLSRQNSQQESEPLHQNSRHDEALPASSPY
ncbi:LOW QUALITY PROTEIN: desumoylating isopeptidase 1 [Populus alba x Populus x berolinensis]|uniref:Desumoylating isopeptidase 1 n=1 Tax=Populus alba x Populus x berolinensis TaxID=444605 RepID=A0AAD6R0Y9_9ROSI|nr:LOW QUALITY PROTEIN: desumoylating isopeptidase 1 [Populus alba x Populus x berolinensis]